MHELEERNTWVKIRKYKYCIFATSCDPIYIFDKLCCPLNTNQIFYDHIFLCYQVFTSKLEPLKVILLNKFVLGIYDKAH